MRARFVAPLVLAVVVVGAPCGGAGLRGGAGRAFAAPSQTPPGTDARVECLAVAGSRLYLGGHFKRAGGVEARHVAAFEQGAFAPLGAGLDGPAHAMVVGPDGALYVGGAFREAGGVASPLVARWRGAAWEPLKGPAGGLVGSEVLSLTFAGPTLYAAGSLSRIGGRPGLGVARWIGSDWEPVGDPEEKALWGAKRCVVGLGPDEVVVGGHFGREPYRSIARWNGSRFEPLGVAFYDGGPDVLARQGGTLWAGGRFDRVGRDGTSDGDAAGGLATFDGTRWRAIGKGTRTTRMKTVVEALPGGAIHALLPAEKAPADGAQADGLVGGWFHTSNGIPALAVLERGAWSGLGTGLGFGSGEPDTRTELTSVRAMARLGRDLIVGGQFRSAGGLEVWNLARWDGTRWEGVGGAGRLRWPALTAETSEWRPLLTEGDLDVAVRTSRDRTSLILDWRLTNRGAGDLLVTSTWLVQTSTATDDGLRHVHEHREGVVRAGSSSEGGLTLDRAEARMHWAQITHLRLAPSRRPSAGSAR